MQSKKILYFTNPLISNIVFRSKLVALCGDNMDPVKIEVNYEWKFGASNIESILNSELTSARILETTYNGYKIYFNCGTVSYFRKI